MKVPLHRVQRHYNYLTFRAIIRKHVSLCGSIDSYTTGTVTSKGVSAVLFGRNLNDRILVRLFSCCLVDRCRVDALYSKPYKSWL